MDKKRFSGYELIVFTAYGYFLLLGLVFLMLSWYISGNPSYVALLIIAVFSAQCWFRHKLGNLIIGVLTLGGSIFGLLEFLSTGLKGGFNSFTITMTSIFVAGIIFSGILIFSYTRLSFKDR